MLPVLLLFPAGLFVSKGEEAALSRHGAAQALHVSSHLTFALPLPLFVFHESGINLDMETFKTSVARRAMACQVMAQFW